MKNIFTNNAYIVGKEHNSSIIGDFMTDYPELLSSATKVKYVHHPKGEKREVAKSDSEYTTVTILIQGIFIVSFPEEGETVTLSKEGDLVVFQPNVSHRWESIEESKIICIKYKK